MEHVAIASTEAARKFILGGNARVTIRSKVSGVRFSYRVRKSEDGSIFFVSVLTGSDNEGDYTYAGTLKPSERFRHGVKSKIQAGAPSVKAFDWVWAQLLTKETLPETLEVFHEGRCGRCNRALTVPESIESGFGPECINHVH